MRRLDRYVLREWMVPFGYCLAGFVLLWLVMTLFDGIDEFRDHKLQFTDVAEYCVIKLPEVLVQVMPMALLLSLLYALSQHARHHEITAMRAAGVSLWRLAAPYFAVGILLSLGVFAINEWWVPQTAEQAERVVTRRLPDASRSSRDWESRLGFFNAVENRQWLIGAYHVPSHRMVHPHLLWALPDGSRREITAERAWRDDDAWVFTNVQELVYPPGAGSLPVRNETNLLTLTGLMETPEVIRSEIKVAKMSSLRQLRKAQFSIREILDYQRLHPGTAEANASLNTKLHERLASPWTCFFVVLMALPFGAASGRRNVYVGVASSIVICFAYYTCQMFALALGSSGRVPPWAAAWGPNVIFGLIGLVLTARVR